MKTFIARIEAGLGNQMFQYAHVRALQLKFGGRIIFDVGSFVPEQNRRFGLKNFRLCQDIAWKPSLVERMLCRMLRMWQGVLYGLEYRRKDSSVLPYVRLGFYHQPLFRYISTAYKPVWPYSYVRGNFLSEKFFKEYREQIIEDFTIETPMPAKVQALAERIRSVNAVCIHIRLGDYLAPEWRDKLYICGKEYYQKAIERIKSETESPVFFVFSNTHKDFEMIRNDFGLDSQTIYVDEGNADYEDMWLMSQCRHFIMSNSTYSWWAQYLGKAEDKIVIAPSKFNKYPRWDMTDIYQDNWELIDAGIGKDR